MRVAVAARLKIRAFFTARLGVYGALGLVFFNTAREKYSQVMIVLAAISPCRHQHYDA